MNNEEKNREVASALFQYGKSLCKFSKHRQAVTPFEQAIALLETIGNKDDKGKLAKYYYKLGNEQYNCFRFSEAHEAYQKSKHISTGINSYSYVKGIDLFVTKTLAPIFWLLKKLFGFAVLLFGLMIIVVISAIALPPRVNEISTTALNQLTILAYVSNLLSYLNDYVNEAAEDVRNRLDL